MPIYEYRCRSCNHQFEYLLRSAAEKVACPLCASKSVAKQLSVFAAPAGQPAEASPVGGCTGTPETCGCR